MMSPATHEHGIHKNTGPLEYSKLIEAFPGKLPV